MPCCSPVQSIKKTLQKNARTYHNFSRIHVKEVSKEPCIKCIGHQGHIAKMPCCSCTEKNIRTKQNFYRNSFYQAAKKHPRRPGLSKNTAKILCCPLYRASRKHCKNARWLIYQAKYTNIADVLKKCLVAFQAPAEGISKDPQKCLVGPLYKAFKEHCKKTPAQTTIFPESLPGISKQPRKIQRCSCIGHPKKLQKTP